MEKKHNTFEYVKKQINIIDVVQKDEPLTKESGPEWSGAHVVAHSSTGKRCLFVNEVDQIWHCFHCNAGGDIFDYVALRDKSTKFEALEWLCKTFNIQPPDWTPEQKVEFERQQQERSEVRSLIKEAFRFYHQNMANEQRSYYHSRGLTDETIDRLLCGYAGTNNVLFKHMIKKHGQSDVEQLLKTGLFFKLENGKIRDRYHDRFVIPYWKRNEIVFSIGRSIDPNIEAHKKYVKHLTHSKYPYVSPVAVEHIIYGEDKVRGAQEIIITEGIFDVMLAIQAGYSAISPVTTNFSNKDNERLSELTKHAQVVYLLNDNEVSGAGMTGAIKTAKVLTKAGVNVKLCTIPRPEGKDKVDLADYIQTAGDKAKEKVDELLENAETLLNYQLGQIPKNIDKLELANKVQVLLKEQLEFGRDKTLLRMWLDHKLKARFDLKDKDIRNYQTMLTQLTKTHEQAVREQERKQRQQDQQQQLSELKENDISQYIKARIHETRTEPYKKAFEIKKSISSIVIKDMRSHGKFYKTGGNLYYYFNNDTCDLVEIGDVVFTHYINHRYGINKSEDEYRYLLFDLEAEADLNGDPTEVYRFAHYDVKRHVLYIDKNDHSMCRLNGETIDILPNGSENVLFITDPTIEPFELVDIGDKKFIEPIIIEPTNFTKSEDVNLSKVEQQFLLGVVIDALPFEELQPTKIIPLFLGEAGSGKSVLQKKIGKWLFGRKFNVQNVTTEDNFLTSITHNYLACFDNAERYVQWLEDMLSLTATGQVIERRKLYTTNELARYYPRCFVTLGVIQPKFKRPDVVDRLVLFRMQRLKHFKSEARILKEIADNRNELWSEYLIELNNVVKALREDSEPFTTSFRMADFAELGWRISKANSAGDLWLELLDKMQRERSEFLLLDDPIFLCIQGLLTKGVEIDDMTASQLYKIFKKYAEDEGVEFGYIKSAQSLGRRLGYMLNELRAYFEVKRERPDTRTGYHYSFSLKEN